MHYKKTLAVQDLFKPPYLVPTGPTVPNIYWLLSPLELSMSAKFGLDWLQFAGVIPEKLVFKTPKVITI